MIIASFDAALKNLGICYVKFNELWHTEIPHYVNQLNQLYSHIDELSTVEFIQRASQIITEIDNFVNNILTIIFFNVIDLAPGEHAKNVNMNVRTKRLKYLITLLQHQLDPPDVVLIEYQMRQNDISRTISNQIAMMYMPIDNVDINHINDESTSCIKYYIDAHKIDSANYTARGPIVKLVSPSLKNTMHLYKGGEYSNFIANYSNYTANKKHTSANFVHYMNVFNTKKNININGKIDDIADSFMMILTWLSRSPFIDATFIPLTIR